MKKPLLRRLWCDRVAPLGNPVVPEVYWMLMGSSNCSADSRSASCSSGTCAESRSSASHPSSSTRASPPRAVRAPAADLAEHAHVVGLPEGAGEDEEAHPGLRERVLELGGAIGGGEVDENGADRRGGVRGDHPLVPVRRPHADPVAAADAPGHKPPCGLAHAVPE